MAAHFFGLVDARRESIGVGIMDYPLIDRQLLSSLRLVHGGFNLTVAALLFYHACQGIQIRAGRLAGAVPQVRVIKRHRKLGPPVVVLGTLGFLFGITLVLLDTGRLLEHPSHLVTGIAIVLLLALSFAISRRIKGPSSSFRTPHFIIGIVILFLYVVELFLGLGALL